MALQNRTPTYKEETTQFAAVAATVALTPLLINGRVWIPLNTAAGGVLNSFFWKAQISDYAQAAVAFAAGDKIYWDDGASKFTNVAAGNTPCGFALEASLASSGAGIIQFDTFADTDAVAIANLNAWATALATKLNADAGVTDANYDTDPQA
jgi:hypothetical protein